MGRIIAFRDCHISVYDPHNEFFECHNEFYDRHNRFCDFPYEFYCHNKFFDCYNELYVVIPRHWAADVATAEVDTAVR